ncbi:hypothetical protein AMK59_3126 [Oryctes borbonicus]|uniref:Cilium assembly protein DZIP1 domain-containing protein n=1 Tax=Oryctes borbonicus TaxID=1629725 RepID=A0A0T6B654_9SCAR|nr:hypothetical protein AMK59_3126 [Oryctes borbonicus]
MDSFWKKLSDLELEKKQNNNYANNNNARAVLLSTKPLENLYLSSNGSASNISLEEVAAMKTIPVPVPRILNQNKAKEIKPQVKMITPIRKATVVKPKIEQTMIETSSEEESSSSDDTVEIIKPPIRVTPVKRLTKTELLKTKHEKPKIAVKYIKAPKEELDISLESESEEDIRIMTPQNKPSTSTLGQRSVTSLKQTMKDQSVIKGLNKEILKMVNLRLREIGISPHWKGIPEKSYQQATRVVNHQTELSKRKFPNYQRIRESLLKILDEKVKDELKGSKSDVENKTDKPGKMLILKKFATKRHTKHTKLKQSSDNNHPSDISNEPIQPKPQIRQIKEFSEKENRVQQPTTISQDKPILIAATPIKKKVLFDLEDALTASKIVIQPPKIILETSQRQQYSKDDYQLMAIEKTAIVSGSEKIENKPMDNEGSGGTLKPQKISKINDGGSISSLGSSLLEVPKGKSKQDNVLKDDLSDWDISDILT